MSELNRDDRIRELFLKVFMEEGVSEEELKRLFFKRILTQISNALLLKKYQ